LEIPFEGKTFPQNFMLADGYLDWDNPHQNVAICFAKNNTVGFFPFKEKYKYRMFSFLGNDGKAPEDHTEADIIDKVENQMNLKIKVKKVIWFSVFKIHSRIVRSFQKGRCFLVGDAAHIHSPAGAQGMNTGFQDAYNLAWKLAMVQKGIFSDSLLTTYEKERKKVAKGVLKNTDNAFQFIISKKPFYNFMRLRALPNIIQFFLKNETLRKFAFKRLSQIIINYFVSPLNINYDKDGNFTSEAPLPGDRFPHFLIDKEQQLSVHDLMKDPGFYLLYIGSGSKSNIPDELFQWKKEEEAGWIKFINLSENSVAEDLRRQWGISEPSYFLIRPDIHVAIRSQPCDLGPLQNFLQEWKCELEELNL
jgi:hypothetical protein